MISCRFYAFNLEKKENTYIKGDLTNTDKGFSKSDDSKECQFAQKRATEDSDQNNDDKNENGKNG